MKTFKQFLALPVSTASPANVSQTADLSSMFGPSPIWFQVEGTLAGTYLPEISADGITWVDGTKWFFDLAAGIVLPGGGFTTDLSLYSKQNLPFLRFRCTAFAGPAGTGDATARVAIMAQDSRSH